MGLTKILGYNILALSIGLGPFLSTYMTAVLNLKNYLIESIAEMKNVIWPTKQQTINYTILVVALSVGVAFFFGVLDYIFNLGLEFLIG